MFCTFETLYMEFVEALAEMGRLIERMMPAVSAAKEKPAPQRHAKTGKKQEIHELRRRHFRRRRFERWHTTATGT